MPKLPQQTDVAACVDRDGGGAPGVMDNLELAGFAVGQHQPVHAHLDDATSKDDFPCDRVVIAVGHARSGASRPAGRRR